MNINPSAASIAGTSRAAARGGEADNQAAEATRQQTAAEKPAGKDSESNAVDAGDQTDDRGGNGRQMLDTFERSEDGDDAQNQNGEQTSVPPNSAGTEGSGNHLDFEA